MKQYTLYSISHVGWYLCTDNTNNTGWWEEPTDYPTIVEAFLQEKQKWDLDRHDQKHSVKKTQDLNTPFTTFHFDSLEDFLESYPELLI